MRSQRSSFQTLALWTTGTTYFLILVGGLVRASGAGLGCPDWPRCFGSWIPPASVADLPAGFDAVQFNHTLMWTEYLNRLLGVAVGLLIFATLVSAWRHHRHVSQIFWPTLAAFLLVGFQGWLGGVVVQQELAAWIVTVHMLVALVIVSLLLYSTTYAWFGEGAGTTATARGDTRRVLAWSLGALIVVSLIQVVLGTQVREGIDEGLARGLERGTVLSHVGAVDLYHRELALLVVALTLWVVWYAFERSQDQPDLFRAALVVAGLVGAQVGVGLSMAYWTLAPAAQVAHLSISTLLLGAETVLLLLIRWLPRAATLTAPAHESRAQAAPRR